MSKDLNFQTQRQLLTDKASDQIAFLPGIAEDQVITKGSPTFSCLFISSNIGWISVKFCMNIHGSQMTSPDFRLFGLMLSLVK